jgi:hypothetical protein
MLDKTLSISCQDWDLARIIHEGRRETFENEARRARGSARRPKAPADGSDGVAGIHDLMKQPNG